MWKNKKNESLFEKYGELEDKINIQKTTVYVTKIRSKVYFGYNASQLYEQLAEVVIKDVEKLYWKLSNIDRINERKKYLDLESITFDHRLIIDNFDYNFDVYAFEEVYKTKIEFFKKINIKN